MSSVRVGVVSDESLFAKTLCRVVSAESSFRLISIDPVDPAAAGLPASKNPEPYILLLDSRNPDSLGLCQRLSDQGVAQVIVLGVPDDQASAIEALLAGARGILYKRAQAEEVVKAIRMVSDGGVWAPRQVIVAAWGKVVRRPAVAHAIDTGKFEQLSDREKQVLGLAAAGLANKELADRLAITEATVKTHLTRVFRKLGVRSRAELAAAYHGIVPPDTRTSHPTTKQNVVRPKAN